MNITGVESTTLKSIGYDESVEALRPEFRSGAVYDYFGVPEEVYGALLGASSIGACFNEMVRGRFPFRRIWQMESVFPSGGQR